MKYQEVYSGYQQACREQAGRHQSLAMTSLEGILGFDAQILDRLWEEPFCDKILLPFLLGGSSEELQLFPEDVTSSAELSRTVSLLGSIRLESNRVYREKGTWNLAFGYPFLEGNFRDGTYVKSPVFLFPAVLEYRPLQDGRPGFGLRNLQGEFAMVNESLIRGFEMFNGDTVPVGAELTYQLGKGVSGLGIVEAVQSVCRKLNLQVFPGGSVSGAVEPMKTYDGSDLPQYEPGVCILLDNLVLGTYSHGPAVLYREYSRILEEYKTSRTAGRILSREPEEGESALPEVLHIDENRSCSVTPLDSSQERSVQAVSMGHQVRIQGAPGSGKTQVLVNIIADQLLKGKNILVVSPKRAALDDAFSRLESIGLGDFSMRVRDPVIDREHVFGKVSSSIEAHQVIQDVDEEEIEGAKLKNRYLQLSHDIEKQLSRLDSLKQIMNSITPLGEKLYELYRKTSRDPDLLISELTEMPGEYGNMGRDSFHSLIQHFNAVLPGLPYLFPGNEVSERKTFSQAQEHDRDSWISTIDLTAAAVDQYLEQEVSDLSDWTKNKLAEDDDPGSLCRSLCIMLDEAGRELESSDLLPPEKITDIEMLRSLLRQMESSHAWQPRFWKALRRLRKAARGSGGLISFSKKLRYTLNIHDRLEEISIACGVRVPFAGKPLLSEEISKLSGLAGYFLELHETFLLLSAFMEDSSAQQLFRLLITGNSSDVLERLAGFRKLLETSFNEIAEVDYEITHADPAASSAVQALMKHCRYDVQRLSEEGSGILENSIYACQIALMEEQHRDILEYSDRTGELAERIHSGMKEKRELMPLLVSRKVNQGISNFLDKSWQPNQICEEVKNKQKKIPLEKCTREFLTEGLLELFPCWMMTPEAALQLVPLAPVFDLVLFDEASLLPAAKALPLLFRGHSAVIAGDEKQLYPRLLDPAEDDPSLFHAAASLETVVLKNHYRSEDEGLFAFPNTVFYRGELGSAPNLNPVSVPIHVTAHSDQAAAAAEKVREFLLSGADKETIGIITFSVSQKRAVSNALNKLSYDDREFRKACRHERERADEPGYTGMFVKTAEEVQGEQRDVIIILDKDASALLSREGGEHLMNVAITRAVKRIFLITSGESASSPDESLMSKYLQYAGALKDGSDAAKRMLRDIGTLEVNRVSSPVISRIAHSLVQRGLHVHADVGLSSCTVDAAVYNPEQRRYAVGIICEDCSSQARETMMHREEMLASRGWNIYRLWSRNWWNNPGKVIQEILQTAGLNQEQLP